MRNKMTSAEIEAQLAKVAAANGGSLADFSVSLDDIESFGNKKSLAEMLQNIYKYNKMLEQRIVLINDALTSAIPFTRENLYLFCAYTGSGKSTVAANISFPLWKQGKKTLVIANEEPEQDVLFRIACLELGLNFNAYKKGEMSTEDQLKALALFPEISKYVKVLDVNYKNALTSTLEGVKSALDSVKKNGSYSCVLIDYYQLVKRSIRDGSRTTFDVLNDFRTWLGQYIKGSDVPVVLFAQLHSVGKRSGVKDVDARIKECSFIIEPATVIIEIIPNFDNQTSEFIIHKDRFGRAGKKIVCAFDRGRFTNLSAEELNSRNIKAAQQRATEEIDKLVGDTDDPDTTVEI